MNHEAVREDRHATDYLSRSSVSAEIVDLLLADVARAAAFDDDPGSSPLWTRAPWHLRHEFADGRCDRETFWLRLRVWLEFQQRGAA